MSLCITSFPVNQGLEDTKWGKIKETEDIIFILIELTECCHAQLWVCFEAVGTNVRDVMGHFINRLIEIFNSISYPNELSSWYLFTKSYKKAWETLSVYFSNKLRFEQNLYYYRPGMITNQNEGQVPDTKLLAWDLSSFIKTRKSTGFKPLQVNWEINQLKTKSQIDFFNKIFKKRSKTKKVNISIEFYIF